MRILSIILAIVFLAAPAMAADNLYATFGGTITSFDVSVQAVGVTDYNYRGITDYVLIGADGAGNQYRIMDVTALVPAGESRQIVVRGCNGTLCVESEPYITGRPVYIPGSIHIESD